MLTSSNLNEKDLCNYKFTKCQYGVNKCSSVLATQEKEIASTEMGLSARETSYWASTRKPMHRAS